MRTIRCRFIPSPDDARRPATTADFKAFFGLKESDKWPKQGMAERTIGVFTVWVDALLPIPSRPRGGRRMRHRVMAKCACGQTMSAGRIGQHACAMTRDGQIEVTQAELDSAAPMLND